MSKEGVVFYPVGSLYESFSSIDPSQLFGGTWDLIYNDYDYKLLGTNVLFDHESGDVGSNQTKKTLLYGSYSDTFINNPMSYVDNSCPTDYEIKHSYSVMISDNNDAYISIFINDTKIINNNYTWSNDRFRVCTRGGFYKISDIPKKNLSDTGIGGHDGYAFYAQCENRASYAVTWHIWNLTDNVYAVSKEKIYKWKKIEE